MADSIAHSLTIVLAKRDAAALAKAAALLTGVQNPNPLAEGKAFDAVISTRDPKQSQISISETLLSHGLEADICVQALEARRKSLLICDMDSTLIGQECIDELADFAGVKDRVSAITERAMRGEIGFDGALTERVGLLKGLPLSALQSCFEQRIRLNAGARTLAQTMIAGGAKTVIVSGGFTFFTARIAALTGFETHQANTLIDDGEHLTGDVGHPILGREAKLEALINHSSALGGPSAVIAIGDGANDLAMIEAAGLGIAYYAKPTVAAAAHCAINHTDLTTALYFQGYSEAEFVDN